MIPLAPVVPAARSRSMPRHLFSIEGLGRDGILAILDRAEELRAHAPAPGRLAGRVLGLLFFQPSTRTRFGFHAAIARSGGTAIELHETKHQAGMMCPESLVDTVRCVSAYCDAIVLRHSSANAFEQAMAASSVPVINGGSGAAHHPTQALIDLFAIRRHFGRIDGLRVGMAGDLRSSRSMRSLLEALACFPPRELRLMIPSSGPLAGLLPASLSARHSISHKLTLDGLDLLYMGGLPEGTDAACHEADRASLRLTAEKARSLPRSALVLDPLPRIDEIEPAVDALPQARYFDQSAEGLHVRGAVVEQFCTVSR